MLKYICRNFALLFFVFINPGFTFSQDFTPEQLQLIREKVQKLASDYQTFSKLSEDGIKISPFYKKKFKSLFDSGNEQINVQIYNDIQPEGNGPAIVDVDEYIRLIADNFPAGLAVQLTNIQVSAPDKDDKNDRYFVIFQAEKRVLGLYQNRFVYNQTGKLYFKIDFIEISENVYDNFFLKSISDKPFKIKKRKIKEHEMDWHLSAGKSNITTNINESANQLSFSPGMGFRAGIHYNYFVNNRFGIGTGIGVSQFNAADFVSEYNQSYESVDPEGESYTRNIMGINLNESYGILYAKIPLNLYFRINAARRFEIQLGAAASMALKLKDSYRLNGIYSFSGYYPRLNVTFENLPEYNFASDTQTDYRGKLDLAPLAVLVSGQINLNYILDSRTSVYLAFLYTRNLNSISNSSQSSYIHSTPDMRFNGLINSGSSINLGYLGIQSGLILKFKKK